MLEVFGDRDSVLRRVEELVECEIVVRGNEIVLRGTERAVDRAEAVFNGLIGLAEDGHHPTPETAERLYKMGAEGGGRGYWATLSSRTGAAAWHRRPATRRPTRMPSVSTR
jgi:phosphate starvation-inducible PhoH-like protein